MTSKCPPSPPYPTLPDPRVWNPWSQGSGGHSEPSVHQMADLFLSEHPSLREALFISKMTHEVKNP